MEHKFGGFNGRDRVQQVVAEPRGYPVRGLSWRFGPPIVCMDSIRISRLAGPSLDQFSKIGPGYIQGMSVWKGEFSF